MPLTSLPPDPAEVDVLIVGAGPTGLTLAAQLRTFGTRFRIVDRAPDHVHESRALAVQARTLEIFATLGIADELIRRGNPGAGAVLHTRPDERVDVRFTLDASVGTRFPFILMVSQAETEALLAEHLASRGVTIERGAEVQRVAVDGSGARCTVRHGDGREEIIGARWIVGCDGAHSVVRKSAGIAFEGDSYAQHYLLGDVEIDGLAGHDVLHAFPAGHGVALIFPMKTPRSWRVIAIPGPARDTPPAAPVEGDAKTQSALTLAELQAAVDAAAGPGLRLHDPAWLTHFRLHHRQATHYRAGPLFVAGDAAHIHSPVGAQGMNTGIQDAWTLGWRLALVARGEADDSMLDAYEAERWPVGRTLLRSTDRAFGFVTRGAAGGPIASGLRRAFVANIAPRLLGSGRFSERVFRFVSQLGIRYRQSPAVRDGTPTLGTGPRAGDRLPDAPLVLDGAPTWLQSVAVGPRLCLLLCGPADGWDTAALAALGASDDGLLVVRHLVPAGSPAPAGALVDVDGVALGRLGVTDAAQYLVRPDGHVAYRCAGRDLMAVAGYVGQMRVGG